MKKLLLVATIAVAFGGAPVFAADMPARPIYKAAAAPAPMSDWTGFYVGANIGYGWGTAHWSDLVAPEGNLPGEFVRHNTNGVLGGLQWGYNRQIGQWVFGFASDFDWSAIKGSSVCLGNANDYQATCGTKANWITTSTFRVGWAMGQFLPYVKGGWALARNEFNVTNIGQNGSGCCGPQADYLPTKSYRSGWTVGGGMEYAFDRNWSAFVEYDYMDFGSNQEGFTPSVPNFITTNFSANINSTVSVVKGGVNFRLGDWLAKF